MRDALNATGRPMVFSYEPHITAPTKGSLPRSDVVQPLVVITILVIHITRDVSDVSAIPVPLTVHHYGGMGYTLSELLGDHRSTTGGYLLVTCLSPRSIRRR